MALYEQENNVTEEQLKQVAIAVTVHLKSKCKFCPRGFEPGEHIVFGTMKNIQMQWLEADVETSEPAGFGESHVIDIINAHLPCAISNVRKFRSVTIPKSIT